MGHFSQNFEITHLGCPRINTLVPVWQFSGGKVYLRGNVSALLYIPPITISLIQPSTYQNFLSIVTFRIDNKLFCQNKNNLKISDFILYL